MTVLLCLLATLLALAACSVLFAWAARLRADADLRDAYAQAVYAEMLAEEDEPEGTATVPYPFTTSTGLVYAAPRYPDAHA